MLASFRYAWQGIISCVRQERNFRIHIAAACYGWMLGITLSLTNVEWTVLILAQIIVLSLELVNTAIEAAIDIACPQHQPLAKLAKDAAAGAVLVATLGSVVVGFCLFWRPALFVIAGHILTTPWLFVWLMVSISGFIWFIFGFKEK